MCEDIGSSFRIALIFIQARVMVMINLFPNFETRGVCSFKVRELVGICRHY